MKVKHVNRFVLLLLCSFMIYYYITIIDKKHFDFINQIFDDHQEAFLINTSKCEIPYVEPFNRDTIHYFKKKKYIKCSDYNLLTYIENKRKNVATLYINNSLLSKYSWFPITCCYRKITRNIQGSDPDNDLLVSDCVFFEKSTEITSDLIEVTCATLFRTVYKNVHSIIFKKIKTNKNQNASNTPYSVLLIGVDSVSQQNLIRTMPNTHDYLIKNNNWVKLNGYNKVDDNTFPNIMALLTGSNYTYQVDTYGPFEEKPMDEVDFLWKHFKEQNYVTAYAEDWVQFGTFNHVKKGFYKEPTDLYFRPYLVASEGLPSSSLYMQGYCSGPQTSGERILNIVKDYVTTYKNNAKFGFFWMNTFSHNNINDPTMMDDTMRKFMEELQNTLEYTIVIFFSDHGFRYGNMRLTYSGWLEERLPFMYLMIPNSFKLQYSNEYINLLDNSKQLTNTYDLYLTLQHILQLSNKNYTIKPSKACPNCQSLFNQIQDRNCTDISIEKHWCTCTKYRQLTSNYTLVKAGANFLIETIRTIINSYGKVSRFCMKYILGKVTSASIDGWKSISDTELTTNLLLVIQTVPDAAFEATLIVNFNLKNSTAQFKLSSSVSRIDRYAGKVLCVKDSPVQKYCYCSSITSELRQYFCNDFYCLKI